MGLTALCLQLKFDTRIEKVRSHPCRRSTCSEPLCILEPLIQYSMNISISMTVRGEAQETNFIHPPWSRQMESHLVTWACAVMKVENARKKKGELAWPSHAAQQGPNCPGLVTGATPASAEVSMPQFILQMCPDVDDATVTRI